MTRLQVLNIDWGLGLVRIDERTHLWCPEGRQWLGKHTDGGFTAWCACDIARILQHICHKFTSILSLIE